MTATVSEARDQIHAQFRTAWLADPNTQAYFVEYEDVAQGDVPEKAAARPLPWARFTMRHNPGTGGQVAYGIGDQANGARRYRRFGVITINLFAPKGDGMKILDDEMTPVAMRAFEGKTTSGGVQFLRVRPVEIGPDGDYFQANVLVDFEYDEVR